MSRLANEARDMRPAYGRDGKKKTNRLYQTSTMTALFGAVYDGTTTMAQFLEHGNSGIGTFDALDGELILLDGLPRRFRGEGQANEVKQDVKTPFACAAFFEPEQTPRIDRPASKHELEQLVDRMVGNDNLFAAVRVTGTIEEMETRAVFRQLDPYPPMLHEVSRQPTLKLGAAHGFHGWRACQQSADGTAPRAPHTEHWRIQDFHRIAELVVCAHAVMELKTCVAAAGLRPE